MAFAPSGTSALTFTFSTQSLRVILRDGEPWFVAADALATLGLDRKALERLDEDERGVSSIHTLGGTQELTVINESGLYSLILGSRKPEAKKFKKWVTAEVLPAIRKTGRYEMQARQGAERLSNADMMNIKRMVWHSTNRYHCNAAWTQGVWFHLRRQLGVPSPYPFTTDQLPLLAAELARVAVINEQVSDIVRTVEHEAVRRILRRGEDAEAVLNALRAEAEKATRSMHDDIRKLPLYIAKDVQAVLERSRRSTYDHGNDESPGAIEAVAG